VKNVFLLLAGKYRSNGVVYNRGDRVISEKDLLKHNRGGNKFQLLGPAGEESPSSQSVTDQAEEDGFEDMTVAELRAQAEEDDVDLGTSHLKAEIIAKLRAAYAG